MAEFNNDTTVTPSCPPIVDASFGPVVKGCRDDFDFTFAFEQYLFAIVPSAVGLLLAAIRIAILRRMKNVITGGRTFKWTKLAVIGIFASLQLVLLAIWTSSEIFSALKRQTIAAASLSFIAAISFSGLSYYEHHKSLRPSWLLTAYLAVTLLLDAAIIRTIYLSPSVFPLAVKVISSVALAFKVGVISVEAIEKQRFHGDQQERQRCPENYTGPFGQILYLWLNGLIRKGFSNVLNINDLFHMDKEMEAENLDERFSREWRKGLQGTNPSLALTILKIIKVPLLLAIIPRLVLIVFIFCQPLLLETFLGYLKDPEERKNGNIGKAMIGAYALVYVGMGITSAFYWYRNIRCVTMMRGILISAVYNKTTRISITALNNAESVTLMSGDVENLIRGLREIHEIWAAILQIGIATWLLARQLGPASVGPIIVCFVSALVMGMASPLAKKYQLQWMEELQKRTGITSSAMGTLKGIKILGLTRKLTDFVQKLRVDEVTASKRFRILAVFSSTLAFAPTMLSPAVTFAIYLSVALRNHTTLDAQRMFTSLSLLMLITQPLFGVFQDIFEFMSSLACLQRIEKFLKAETRGDHRLIVSQPTTRVERSEITGDGIELGSLNIQRMETFDDTSPLLEVQDGSFGWNHDETPALKDINFTVESGNLVMICGPVASGKTTLLKALLGENINSKGFVRLMTDSIAYCDQTPWLTGTSIKNNITVFSRFNQTLYNEVLQACDLNPDLAVLPDGDDTIVGSKGIALSGGQKQRVALARALYGQKDLIILDDVFSGLDTHTQAKVFSRVFSKNGLLRKSKSTVILATHTINLLPYADKILVLGKEGSIVEQGSFQDLMKLDDGYVNSTFNEFEIKSKRTEPSASEEGDSLSDERPNLSKKKSGDSPTDLKRQSGDWSLYSYLFSRIGPRLTILFFTLQVLWAFFSAFPTLWLKWWSDANEQSANQRAGLYIGVYTVLQLSALVSTALLTWCCINIMARKSGIEFHRVLINTVMGAPMSFISKMEVGSLVNRFTQDLSLIDRQMPIALMCCVSNLFIAIAQAILISTASAYIAISFPALIFAFYMVQKYYLRTSRQLRLLDLEAKAPVYTLFLESLEGLATIRAFDWQSSFIAKNHDLVDTAQSPFYLLALLQKWLTLVLDLMTAALAVLVVGITVATREKVSIGFTGVALTQIMGFTEYLKMLMLFWTQLETSLGAISRIRSFSEETPQEIDGGEKPAGWPSQGRVEISRLSAGYDERMVLKEVHISIEGGQRFGVCGRTGSGKSSLVLALLRMMELNSGGIFIDGVDVSTIPREAVRTEVNVISQDPFFFAGTLKHNLDPYDAASDEEMTQILRKCQLGHLLDEDKTLEDEFKPDSLSNGQKQLFCLARALLRKGKIVVLDEATSGVDKDTDEMMQAIIGEEMKDRTIIAIAHRLQTIMDYDKVAVMEDGMVVEIGNPRELLNAETKFRQLAEAM